MEEVPEEIIKDEEETQTPSGDKEVSSVKDKSPWKTGVHHMTPEHPQLPQMELEEPTQELRRTTRKCWRPKLAITEADRSDRLGRPVRPVWACNPSRVRVLC